MSFTLYKTGQRSTGRLDVTDIGRSTFMALILVLAATLVIPAFGVFATLLSLEVIALLVGVFYRPRIDIKGTLPHRIVADQVVHFEVTLRNVSHWPAYQLSVLLDLDPDKIEQLEPIPYLERLRPGQEALITLSVQPHKRGSLLLKKPQCSSIFPFNLFRFNTPLTPWADITVLPAHQSLTWSLGSPNRVNQSGEIQSSHRFGVSPEYIGNRPFVTGDSPRLIDSRAWARLSKPAVKEFQRDMQSDVGLILDNSLSHAGRTTIADQQDFEAAVSLCASVTVSLRQGSRIELLALGSHLYQFPGLSQPFRVERTLQILADARLETTDQKTMRLDLTDSFFRLGVVIFILRHWNPHDAELLYCANQARCHISLFWVGSQSHLPPSETLPWIDQIHVVDPTDILAKRIRPL